MKKPVLKRASLSRAPISSVDVDGPLPPRQLGIDRVYKACKIAYFGCEFRQQAIYSVIFPLQR